MKLGFLELEKQVFLFILGAISSQNDLNVSIETVDGKQ